MTIRTTSLPCRLHLRPLIRPFGVARLATCLAFALALLTAGAASAQAADSNSSVSDSSASDSSASDSSASDSAAAQEERSATVAGLLDLLEADMTEEVVLLWLDTRDAEKAPPSAADLVALRDAGAGDAVLKKLLSLATGTGEAETPETAETDETDETDEAAPAASSAPSEPAMEPEAPARQDPDAAARPEPVDTPEPPPGDVVVDFTLSYLPDFRADETEWGLYVYLDGKPLSYVAVGSRLLGEDALRFRQTLTPGRHQIRIAQEIHEPGRDSDSYLDDAHRARMSPVDLVFELAPGTAEVEIRTKRPLVDLRGEGPITYRVAQNGRVLLAEDGVGGDPDGWTPICDDATVAGREAPRGCRGWPTFWSVDAPPRREVLRALSLFEYRPVPKNQTVH